MQNFQTDRSRNALAKPSGFSFPLSQVGVISGWMSSSRILRSRPCGFTPVQVLRPWLSVSPLTLYLPPLAVGPGGSEIHLPCTYQARSTKEHGRLDQPSARQGEASNASWPIGHIFAKGLGFQNKLFPGFARDFLSSAGQFLESQVGWYRNWT